jgi:hypothetical protein
MKWIGELKISIQGFTIIRTRCSISYSFLYVAGANPDRVNSMKEILDLLIANDPTGLVSGGSRPTGSRSAGAGLFQVWRPGSGIRILNGTPAPSPLPEPIVEVEDLGRLHRRTASTPQASGMAIAFKTPLSPGTAGSKATFFSPPNQPHLPSVPGGNRTNENARHFAQ